MTPPALDIRRLTLGQPGLTDDDDDMGPCRGIAIATAISLVPGAAIWALIFAAWRAL